VGLNVSVDTNIFVGVLNKESLSASSKEILDRIDSGSLSCVVSTVVIAEMCAGYHLAGETKEKDDFLTHLQGSQNYDIIELSVGIADQAGRIKAATGLKLPDAIIVASAVKGDSECLITNDESLKKAEKFIRVVTSKEFVDGKEEADDRA
jgi:predicted nucleic acid-binding protein